MRVAIVYDWLVTRAGGERVLEEVLRLYPEAQLFALLDYLPPDQRGFLGGHTVKTSFFQSLPMARRFYRHFLPLMPAAVESLDVSGYDLVISISHAVAKGVLTGPDQVHVSYIFSPMRYAFDLRHTYLRETGNDVGWRGILAHSLLSRLRTWDVMTSQNIDQIATISHFVARRTQKAYHRPSRVIYPPVNVEAFPLRVNKDDFYITVSRLVPYKRVDAIIKAFHLLPDRKLVVIGDGPEREKIKALAGPNVTLMGRLSDPEVAEQMGRAKAFLFAAEEDFGISPLEAQACGTPVIALNRGGAVETIMGLDHIQPTGIFFNEPDPTAIAQAVRWLEGHGGVFDPRACRQNAERFSVEKFRQGFVDFVSTAMTHSQMGAKSCEVE